MLIQFQAELFSNYKMKIKRFTQTHHKHFGRKRTTERSSLD